MGPFRWLLIHDNRVLAERAFYCFVALLSCSRLFFRKCDQDQSDCEEEDQRQHAVFGVVEKVCTEGNDQRAEEVRKLAEYVKEAEVFAGFVLRDDFSVVGTGQCLDAALTDTDRNRQDPEFQLGVKSVAEQADCHVHDDEDLDHTHGAELLGKCSAQDGAGEGNKLG